MKKHSIVPYELVVYMKKIRCIIFRMCLFNSCKEDGIKEDGNDAKK